jgi:hypothetical protein
MELKKINAIDLMLLLFIVFLGTSVFWGSRMEKNNTYNQLVETVIINYPEQAKIIYPEASKGGYVYVNSTKRPVQIVEVEKLEKNNEISGLRITLRGPGSINNDISIFNGLRVLINQKVELHGKFYAVGAVESIRNAD